MTPARSLGTMAALAAVCGQVGAARDLARMAVSAAWVMWPELACQRPAKCWCHGCSVLAVVAMLEAPGWPYGGDSTPDGLSYGRAVETQPARRGVA